MVKSYLLGSREGGDKIEYLGSQILALQILVLKGYIVHRPDKKHSEDLQQISHPYLIGFVECRRSKK